MLEKKLRMDESKENVREKERERGERAKRTSRVMKFKTLSSAGNLIVYY